MTRRANESAAKIETITGGENPTLKSTLKVETQKIRNSVLLNLFFQICKTTMENWLLTV